MVGSRAMGMCIIAMSLVAGLALADGVEGVGSRSNRAGWRASMKGGFQLLLDVIEGERSKDSHQRHYKIRVDVAPTVYEGPYGRCVRGQCVHKSLHFLLDADTRARLLTMIRAKGLLRPFREVRSIRGHGTYLQATVTVRLRSQSATTTVIGMRRSWTKSDQGTAISPAGRERAAAIRQLVREFTRIAKANDPLFH
ncbi:MAG: hypothetical protein KC609_15265 [Myxococcales bacterium]|nr:hypothetical protein [Myxococcales bacterium]